MLYSSNRFRNLDADLVEEAYNNAPDVSDGPINEAPDVTTGPTKKDIPVMEAPDISDGPEENISEASYLDSLLESLNL